MTSKTEIAWVAAKLSTPSHKIYWALKQENYSRQVSLHFWILTVLTGGRQALLWGDICHPGAGLRTTETTLGSISQTASSFLPLSVIIMLGYVALVTQKWSTLTADSLGKMSPSHCSLTSLELPTSTGVWVGQKITNKNAVWEKSFCSIRTTLLLDFYGMKSFFRDKK